MMKNKYSWKEEIYDAATKICRALTIIHMNMFSIRSDGSDAYKSYEKGLFEHGIQANEQERKRQKSYEASRRMRLNKDNVFSLQKNSAVRKNHNYSQDLHLDQF